MAKGPIEIKSKDEVAWMREAALAVHEVLDVLERAVAPGVSLDDLDALAERETRARGGTCAFKGLYGFPKSICLSVNEQVIHGIPSRRKLRAGDLCKLDFGVVKRGYYGDAARTVAVGAVAPEAERLSAVTRAALEAGLAAAIAGNRVSDIGAAVEAAVAPHGYGIVRGYSGHGIGKALHEAPSVPNLGPVHWDQGAPNPRLRPGMVLAIEPMVNLGAAEVDLLPDGWTVVTRDGKVSAHWEHTVAVTEAGPSVLTRP